MEKTKVQGSKDRGDMDISDILKVRSDHPTSIDDSPSNGNVTRRHKMSQAESALRQDFQQFQNTILTTLEKGFCKQDAQNSRLLEDFREIKSSIKFLSDKYDQLVNIVEESNGRMSALEKRVDTIDQQKQHILELESKLDTIEQHARLCNIEIGNLPDKKGEDLISLVEGMGTLVKRPILRQDIVFIHRVPHITPSNPHFKNVIVKFNTQLLRDEFITAVRLAKGITSEQLQISGPCHKIFVNEHLTLKKKALFRDAKKAATLAGFKFVWIKHGNILVRATETSPIFAIRSYVDLSKIYKDSS